jgi:hypothetical protein
MDNKRKIPHNPLLDTIQTNPFAEEEERDEESVEDYDNDDEVDATTPQVWIKAGYDLDHPERLVVRRPRPKVDDMPTFSPNAVVQMALSTKVSSSSNYASSSILQPQSPARTCISGTTTITSGTDGEEEEVNHPNDSLDSSSENIVMDLHSPSSSIGQNDSTPPNQTERNNELLFSSGPLDHDSKEEHSHSSDPELSVSIEQEDEILFEGRQDVWDCSPLQPRRETMTITTTTRTKLLDLLPPSPPAPRTGDGGKDSSSGTDSAPSSLLLTIREARSMVDDMLASKRRLDGHDV